MQQLDFLQILEQQQATCPICSNSFKESKYNSKHIYCSKNCRGKQYYIENREKKKQYYIENREKIKQYRIENREKKKQYRIENREKIKNKKKQYYIENREKIKQYYIENIEEIKKKKKQYCIENIEEIKKKNKQYYIENIEKIKNKNKQYYIENIEEIKKKKKQYCIENREKIKQYYIENREKKNEYDKKRRQTDINYKILITLRNRIRNALKNKKEIKSKKTLELLGCSLKEARNYIQSQFKEGMTWENHGYKGWHIDHIIPCAAFDLTDPEQQKKCFHYTNLQPLWWNENLSKGSKILKEHTKDTV
jgi:hypothetical protein